MENKLDEKIFEDYISNIKRVNEFIDKVGKFDKAYIEPIKKNVAENYKPQLIEKYKIVEALTRKVIIEKHIASFKY